jgi:hypothetical protein
MPREMLDGSPPRTTFVESCDLLPLSHSTDWSQCTWCESTQECFVASSFLGPSDDVFKNLFPSDGVCLEWRYGQCAVDGRFIIISVFVSLLLCILWYEGSAVACALR